MTPEEGKAAELAAASVSVQAIGRFRSNLYHAISVAIQHSGSLESIDPKKIALFGVPLLDAIEVLKAIDGLNVVIDVQDKNIVEAGCKMTELQTANPALKAPFDRLRAILTST